MNKIGEFTLRKTCRFCQGTNLSKFLDLGIVPLAGGFLREEDFDHEKYYPLTLNFCRDCSLVQVGEVVSGDVLFNESYFFHSSAIGTLVDHFKRFAQEIYNRFLKNISQPSILEIGCNDGVLLRPLYELGVCTIGVDPAPNVVNKIDSTKTTVINDFFTERIAKRIKEKSGNVDAILSSYSFAHIDDMVDVMKGVKTLLKKDGVFIVEIYYLGTILDGMQYDMIYHEHMSYYSIHALMAFLKQYDMEIFDVEFIPGVRAGSIRFYAKNIGQREESISPAVVEMVNNERDKGYNNVDIYKEYANKVESTKKQIIELLDSLKREGKKIIGYGASGRGTTIMNYCGIDRKYIDYIVDDAPAKHGFFTPGTHLPIKTWDAIDQLNLPDYIVLFAWAFTDEVLNKRRDYINRGGKFILPLPKVKIVSK